MMSGLHPLIDAEELQAQLPELVVIDCRFSLQDTAAGELAYQQSHIAGAHYLHLNRDMSGPLGPHGGRHPLPNPIDFCQRLAGLGIGRDTPVVAYDDSGFAYAARLWWMMRALGYSNVRVLNGGLAAWQRSGGSLDTVLPAAAAVTAHTADEYSGCLDIEGLRNAQEQGALLLDSREARRYQGLEEPIDPVAGHIPGALSYPWQDVTDALGLAHPGAQQSERFAALEPDRKLVVYCGSGVTACVNLLALELAGRNSAALYAGSWSDWCSWLQR